MKYVANHKTENTNETNSPLNKIYGRKETKKKKLITEKNKKNEKEERKDKMKQEKNRRSKVAGRRKGVE